MEPVSRCAQKTAANVPSFSVGLEFVNGPVQGSAAEVLARDGGAMPAVCTRYVPISREKAMQCEIERERSRTSPARGLAQNSGSEPYSALPVHCLRVLIWLWRMTSVRSCAFKERENRCLPDATESAVIVVFSVGEISYLFRAYQIRGRYRCSGVDRVGRRARCRFARTGCVQS